MVRNIGKSALYLMLILLLVMALFAAFNWTLVRNMVGIAGVKITEVDKFQPALTVKGCSGPALPAAAPGVLPAASFAAMKAYSDQHQGVGLIVLKDGAVASEAYRPGADATTRSASQSMHKTVVALMIGAAVSDNIMGSADDAVGQYVTEWADDPRGKITLRQLLAMESGLDYSSMAKMELAALDLMMGEATDAALGTAAERPPGKYNYNNVDYQIAGLALSRALKKAGRGDYAAYLSEKLWCPLGNRDATLWQEYAGGEPRYFAFLDASVRDWARVGELIRQQGQWQGKPLISAGWIAAMTAPGKTNANYGLGIWRGSPWTKVRRYASESSITAQHSAPYAAEDVYFLDGYGGQRVYIVPSAGLVISRSGETSQAWDDAVLVNLALKGLTAK
jgi:CubicO group peptidase (beta-lactamase class C family)